MSSSVPRQQAVVGVVTRHRTRPSVQPGLMLPVALIGPAAAVLALVVAFPLAYALYLSFTNFSLLAPDRVRFVGLDNYASLLQNVVFQRAFINTLIFVAIAVNVEFLLGLGIAHLMARTAGGQGFFRTLIMLPMMFAPVVVGFQFKWFFNDQVGLVNNLIQAVTGSQHVIAWLVDVPLGMFSLLVAEIWMSTPFMVVVLLAGLLSLPHEPFEAAQVDGASGWQQFTMLTLPLLQPFIYIAMAIRSLDVARAYDVVRIMTDGGPAQRTELIWTYVFRLAMVDGKFAMGSAMSWVAVLLSFAFTVQLFRQLLKARQGR